MTGLLPVEHSMSFVRISDCHEQEIIFRRHYDQTPSTLEIIQAEPKARFSGILLRLSVEGGTTDELQVRTLSPQHTPACTRDCVAVGDVVKIVASNMSLIYVLTEWDEESDTFTGVWPD
jgi:hypothetical protein